jgi:hypothetical protein
MPTKIKVDIDGKLPQDIGDRVEWVCGTLKLKVRHMSYYRTRRGWHLIITVSRNLHAWKVIAIQAILGSDYRRETFNLRRTGNWRDLPTNARKKWNVLFVQKITFNNG